MTVTAADTFSLRVQVGRFLIGYFLGLAVALRELAFGILLQGGVPGYLAPAWVVVDDATGKTVLKVPAGREANAGPELLADMQRSAAFMAPDHFIERWSR